MIRLVITLGDDGALQLQGPVENPILCYGILQAAIATVTDAARGGSEPKSAIAVVPAGSIPKH